MFMICIARLSFAREHMMAIERLVQPRTRIALLLTLVLTAVPFSGVLSQGAPAPAPAPASTVDVAAQPGDKVKVKIYREEELSGEFVVPENGVVAFPKIGSVAVNTMSTDSLHKLLIAEYSKSLRDPAIEVTVLRRVNVVGSVRSPGFYYADPTVTVKGALALAGGVTPEGNKNKLELLRGGQHTTVSLTQMGTIADSPVQSGDQVSAPEKSWLSRNTALVVSGVTGLALVLVTIIRK
jgi:polysaccharide export outer membrane protein